MHNQTTPPLPPNQAPKDTEIPPYQQVVDEVIKASKKMTAVYGEDDNKAVYNDSPESYGRVPVGGFCLNLAFKMYMETEMLRASQKRTQQQAQGVQMAIAPMLSQMLSSPTSGPCLVHGGAYHDIPEYDRVDKVFDLVFGMSNESLEEIVERLEGYLDTRAATRANIEAKEEAKKAKEASAPSEPK